jgi:hypothetical protein
MLELKGISLFFLYYRGYGCSAVLEQWSENVLYGRHLKSLLAHHLLGRDSNNATPSSSF